MADWSRVVNTTIRKYLRDLEVNVLRKRKITAMLKSRGQISYNNAGDGFQWPIEMKEPRMQGYADADTLTFSRFDAYKTANLDYRGYAITDAMTKQEQLKNRSTEAIVNIYDGITKRLLRSMEHQFGHEFYIDGNLAANAKRLHGLESFFGANAGVSGSRVLTPTDSYAGLNTDLGSYGGAWTGTWPVGKGDAEYDFFSPLIVNYTDPGAAAWTATTKTWANTCLEALRFGIIHAHKNDSADGVLDLILMERDLYRQYLEQLTSKERVLVERPSKAGGLVSFGFGDVSNYDGVEITSEYDIASGVAYGFNFNHIHLRCMQDQLFVNDGPDYDIASKSWRFSLDFFGNLQINPRYFAKWVAGG